MRHIEKYLYYFHDKFFSNVFFLQVGLFELNRCVIEYKSGVFWIPNQDFLTFTRVRELK